MNLTFMLCICRCYQERAKKRPLPSFVPANVESWVGTLEFYPSVILHEVDV